MTQQQIFYNCLGQPISLVALQQAVARLNPAQQIALATFLTGTSNPSIPPKFLALPQIEDFIGRELVEAINMMTELDCPRTVKIFWAIELLSLHSNFNIAKYSILLEPTGDKTID